MEKESKKKTFTDKEIISALVKDLVQFAEQAKKVVDTASIPYSKLEDAVVLESMCTEILEKFVKKEENDTEVSDS